MYEELLSEYDNNLCIEEADMTIEGLYADGCIRIRKNEPVNRKACLLAEELGHHYMGCDDILDQSTLENQKQEYKARRWAFKKLVPLSDIMDAVLLGYTATYEIADYLDLDEEFIRDCLKYYGFL
jgi:hypothetical protein